MSFCLECPIKKHCKMFIVCIDWQHKNVGLTDQDWKEILGDEKK